MICLTFLEFNLVCILHQNKKIIWWPFVNFYIGFCNFCHLDKNEFLKISTNSIARKQTGLSVNLFLIFFIDSALSHRYPYIERSTEFNGKPHQTKNLHSLSAGKCKCQKKKNKKQKKPLKHPVVVYPNWINRALLP